MTKKRIEILAAVLILIGLIFLIGFALKGGVVLDGKKIDGDETSDEDDDYSYIDVIPIGPAEILPNPIARYFVERFGSFSTEADFQNIEDVLSLSTDELKGELEKLLRDSRASRSNGFYGVSTKVLGLNILESTDSIAKIEILTQRKEAIDDPGNTSVRYQNIILDLVKLEGEWLVSAFDWNDAP